MKKQFFYFIGAITFILLGSCKPLSLSVNTIHPDSDKQLTFKVNKGSNPGPVTLMELTVDGHKVASQTIDNLVYTGGPYSSRSNQKLNFTGSGKANNKSLQSSDWVYVSNPKRVFTHKQANGSNNGYPNSTAEQTGANLYRLDKTIVARSAIDALAEYANANNTNVLHVLDVADLTVAAVALYVDQHMSYRNDASNRAVFILNGWLSYNPGWDFPQPADLTLTISGNLTNASPKDDYLGDCEDYAILRAALLRATGFAPWAIWNAIDNPVTHEYNIVLYEGAYRLMDYGLINRYLQDSKADRHRAYYGWNEDFGPRNITIIQHSYLMFGTNNFPGGKECDWGKSWSDRKYFKINCD